MANRRIRYFYFDVLPFNTILNAYGKNKILKKQLPSTHAIPLETLWVDLRILKSQFSLPFETFTLAYGKNNRLSFYKLSTLRPV